MVEFKISIHELEVEYEEEELRSIIDQTVRARIRAEINRIVREAMMDFNGSLRVKLSDIFQRKIMDIGTTPEDEDKLFEAMIEGRI